MIYIIFDSSHKWDDIDNSKEIKYISTNKEKAINIFNHYLSDIQDLDNSKRCYEYDLWEYPDGWNYFLDYYSRKDIGDKVLIMHTDNLKD